MRLAYLTITSFAINCFTHIQTCTLILITSYIKSQARKSLGQQLRHAQTTPSQPVTPASRAKLMPDSLTAVTSHSRLR